MKICYWNLNKKDLSKVLVDLCCGEKLDILILSEHSGIDETIIKSRFADKDVRYEILYVDKSSKVIVIKKKEIKCFLIKDGIRYSAYKIEIGGNNLLMFGIHLPSMMFKSESDVSELIGRIKGEFENLEVERNIYESFVVGDFNLNPFSRGMVSSYGFHSIMCKTIASKKSRKVDGEISKYYYNPMWHLMGNKQNKALGSYFHHKNVASYVWNTFDQVIYRPEMIDSFDETSIRFITEIDKYELLNENGRINSDKYSDHLPLYFEIKEEL